MQVYDMRQILEQNKQILSEYPFLWPIDDNGNRIPVEVFQYSQTLLDRVPPGWGRVMGHKLVQEMKRLCDESKVDYEKCHFTCFAARGGRLILRFNENVQGMERLFDQIEYMSSRICAECGNEAVRRELGSEFPICETCARDISIRRNSSVSEKTFPKLVDEIWLKFDNEKWYEFDGNEWNEYKKEESDEKAE